MRGLHREVEEDRDSASVLRPLKDRAEQILKDLEERKTTGLAAMDLLADIAREKDAAAKAAKDSGLSPRAFGVYWTLKNDPGFGITGIAAMDLARETEGSSHALPQCGRQLRRTTAVADGSLSTASATGQGGAEPRREAHPLNSSGRRRRCGRMTNGERSFAIALNTGRGD